MLNNERNGLYGGIGGKNASQLEEITNQGQIAGLQIIAESVYNALTTEEKENGKMYFILVGQ